MSPTLTSSRLVTACPEASIGFNSDRGTTEAVTPAAAAPEGIPVSLEAVLAGLATGSPLPGASLPRAPRGT